MNNEIEITAVEFDRQFPDQRERIHASVTNWYALGANQYAFLGVPFLISKKHAFIKKMVYEPEDVYIRDTPLSFVQYLKRDKLNILVNDIPDTEFAFRFYDWYNKSLAEGGDYNVQRSIKKIATLHVLHWLSREQYMQEIRLDMWDAVDKNLKQLRDFNPRLVDRATPNGIALLAFIQSAVMEQFISDTYGLRVFSPQLLV